MLLILVTVFKFLRMTRGPISAQRHQEMLSPVLALGNSLCFSFYPQAMKREEPLHPSCQYPGQKQGPGHTQGLSFRWSHMATSPELLTLM